jgi:hypothetical protein
LDVDVAEDALPDKASGASAEVLAAAGASSKGAVGLCGELAVAANGGHVDQVGGDGSGALRCSGDNDLITLRELLGKDQAN